MSKKSMIVHWVIAAALFFGAVWSCRSLSVIAGILLLIGAILYLPIPPISRLWKRPATKIGVMTLVSVLIVASAIINNAWAIKHPELIQTAPVSTSSGEMLPKPSDSASAESTGETSASSYTPADAKTYSSAEDYHPCKQCNP